MLERLVDIHWPVSAVLSDEQVMRADRYLDLKNEQWDLAKELLAPLKQIETATVYISEEEKASVFFLVSFQFCMESLKISALQMEIQPS